MSFGIKKKDAECRCHVQAAESPSRCQANFTETFDVYENMQVKRDSFT